MPNETREAYCQICRSYLNGEPDCVGEVSQLRVHGQWISIAPWVYTYVSYGVFSMPIASTVQLLWFLIA